MSRKSLHVTIGDIVFVDWTESRYGVAVVGTWERRIIAQDRNKITFHFEYPAYEEGGVVQREDEDIATDVGKGVDETYGERVVVKRPGRGAENDASVDAIRCGGRRGTRRNRHG